MPQGINQNPEQIARDIIDKQLEQCGWMVQDKKSLNLFANSGVAVKEYNTDIGPADYVLFVERCPIGIIEAKRTDEGHRILSHEDQATYYANSPLKHLNNEPLLFSTIIKQEITVCELETLFTVCDNISVFVGASVFKVDSLRQSILKKAFEGNLFIN